VQGCAGCGYVNEGVRNWAAIGVRVSCVSRFLISTWELFVLFLFGLCFGYLFVFFFFFFCALFLFFFLGSFLFFLKGDPLTHFSCAHSTMLFWSTVCCLGKRRRACQQFRKEIMRVQNLPGRKQQSSRMRGAPDTTVKKQGRRNQKSHGQRRTTRWCNAKKKQPDEKNPADKQN